MVLSATRDDFWVRNSLDLGILSGRNVLSSQHRLIDSTFRNQSDDAAGSMSFFSIH